MDDSVGMLMLEQVKAIRAEMSGMTAEQRATNERLERLERRQTETEIRLATELVAVAKAIGEVRDLLGCCVEPIPRLLGAAGGDL
jgi:hypothetical protein